MNDDLTIQTESTSIVLKLKQYDDHQQHSSVIHPHTSHITTETIDDGTSPSTLRVKLKNSFLNGSTEHNDEEYANPNSSENLTHLAKRSKKSSSNDNISNNISNINLSNEQISSQQEKQTNDEQALTSNLKNRQDSLTTITTTNSSIGIPLSTVETETNQQSLSKLKNSENGHLISNTSMSTEYLINEQQNCSTTTTTNGHNDTLTIQSPTMPSSSNQTTETHTKELLDEALDSVKNVLMQTFKKNLESGGDLNALKSTLGSDEVAEVFLAKLRQSLKRDTENETKPQESMIDNTPSMISPVMNVVSSSPTSLPSIVNKITSPSSPQSQTNNKRKFSTPSTNPNRFDGTTEEELTKRLLSDILQPNLDIVFVGINPSLYAVHKGHHYGGPGNHFWKLLHMSSLIPNAFTANDDYRMPQYGIGFTNIVQRPSKAGSDITKDEITAGAEVLMQKIKMYRPKIVAFNGRGIYEVYAGNKHFHYGKQPDLFPGTDTHVFVMPSSSARCSQLPRAEDKLPFYIGLKKLRDFVNGTLHSLNEAEITFPDIKIKDTDDVLQKTIIRISNKAFSELSAETLKPYGDKIPSGQMISKHIPCSSPSSFIFNTDALTTQTMSILHNTNHQQNGNLLTYDQQSSRVYQSPQRSVINGIISTKNSFIDNSSSNTNAAVLAALANGGYNSSSQSQNVYIGGQQSVSSTLNNNSTISNSRPSYVIHHTPQSSSTIENRSSSSPILSRQLVVINSSSEPLPSFDTILNSSSQSIRNQQSLSSHPSTPSKQTLIVVPSPTVKSLISTTNSSPIVLPKLSNTNSNEKRPINTTDDCLYVRYERESCSINSDQYRFSYIIDEHSPLLHKRLRYVSINDL